MQAKGPAVVRMEPPIEPSLEKKKLGGGGGGGGVLKQRCSSLARTLWFSGLVVTCQKLSQVRFKAHFCFLYIRNVG